LIHRLQKNPENIRKYKCQLKIIHIHGRLCAYFGEHEDENLILTSRATPYIDSGQHNNVMAGVPLKGQSPLIYHADEYIGNIARYGAKTFRTIHENSTVNNAASLALQESTRIIFTGFAFDPLNLAALGYNWRTVRPDVKITGTRIGLSGNANRSLALDYNAIRNLQPVSTYEFFNNYISLDRPDSDAF
jgi:hypothetical protein